MCHQPQPAKTLHYKTIVWDWNGTLLNDAIACRTIINTVLTRRGIPPISARRYQEIFDFPVEKYYRQLGFDFSKESFEKVGSEFIVLYEQRRHTLRLQPGARSLLRDLHHRGAQQLVLSAYRQATLDTLLKEKKLHHYFSGITGADDHYARGKKDQGLAMLQRLKLNPQTTLLVGDTMHDHEVAVAMGIDCVLLDAGHQSSHRLATCGVPVLANLRALREHLGI
jgi:phosphoglycolate phosphatase